MDNSLTTSNKRKIQLDYLKALAVICVILLHISACCRAYDAEHTTFYNNISFYAGFICDPIFFACAGYLFRKKNVATLWKNRFLKVMIPCFVFTGLKLVYSLFISDDYAHGSGIGEQLYISFVMGSSYWFCYAFMLINLLAPLLWNKNNQSKISVVGVVLILLCFIFTLITEHLNINSPYLYIFQLKGAIQYFPFFAFGYIIKVNENKINSIMATIGRTLYLICTACAFCAGIMLSDVYIFRPIAISALLLFSLELLKNAPKPIIVTLLSKYSLQIMLLDAFYKSILFPFIKNLLSAPLAVFFTVSFLDIALSIATCLIVEKIPYMRKLIGLK